MKKFDFNKDSDNNSEESIKVKHTRKRKIDLIPRIICVLIALGIWIYIFNMNKSDLTTEIELQIEIIGTEVLDENGMMCYGFDQNTVIIKVQGTNRDLRQYKASDYKATVDVSGIIEKGVNNLTVKIESPTNLTVVDKSISGLGVIVDEVATKEISEIEIIVCTPAPGSTGLGGEIAVDTIPVIGAKELVAKIAYIEIELHDEVKEGENISYSEIVESIHYYDSKGKEIVSKGGISIDAEKLKEIGETLTVKIVEEETSETSETDESAESESTESESAETAK